VQRRHGNILQGLGIHHLDKEILGFIGAACINISFIPQIWRLYRLKSAREISLPFTILMVVGGLFWLTYGIVSGLPSVIIANIVATVLSAMMLTAKIIYGRR